jgi:hypothetical protein
MQETEQDPKEAAARADGRIPAEDTRVGMSELQAIWAGQRARGEIFNGCTSVALVERYGDRVYHMMGVGWFVRPDIATDAEVPTVTVTYRRKRWYLAFSKLPDHAPFGPYDLPEAIGQLRVAALLEHIDARTLVLDAAAAEDHTATAPTG